MARLFRPAEKKIPVSRQADGCDLVCGEGGVRTPGPPVGGQRFSRPPHSTTLPLLLSAAKIMFF